MKSISSKLLFAAAILLSLCQLALAGPGDLDLTFGGTGKAIASFGGGLAKAEAAAAQVDGKLILAGYQRISTSPSSQFLIARFDTNNVLDLSFGIGGKVVTRMTTNSSAAQAVAVQADGKILVAGYSYQTPNYSDFVVVRYNADGSLDTTFGTNGIVYTDLGQQAQIAAIAIQADGKIVVDGSLGFPIASNAGIALVRYQTNGTLDGTFGTGGITAVPGSAYDSLYGLALEADQKILAVGQGGVGAFAIYRFTTNGTTDTSFGGGSGHVYTGVPGSQVAQASSVGIQAGSFGIGNPDKIVAAGTLTDYTGGTKFYQLLIRYALDGTLDSTFGNGGIVTNLLANGTIAPTGLRVLGTFTGPRKIIVSGSYSDGTSNYFALNGYTAAGVLDTTFGANSSGKIAIPAGPVANSGDAATTALTLQAGNFVLAGYSGFLQSGYNFAAARLSTTGVLDTSFANNGLLLADIADGPSTATAVAAQTDGKTVAVGHNMYLTNSTARDRFALARFNSDGSADSAFGSNGKTTLNFTTAANASDDAYSMAIQPDGKIIAAGIGGPAGTFALARFKTNGALDSTFGTNGMTTVQVGDAGAEVNAVRIQSDGKILAGGIVAMSGQQRFGLARFTSNGIIDTSFGSGGSVVTTFSSPLDFGFGMGIQADGRIALAGTALAVNGTTVTGDFAAARYTTNGGLDLSFGSLGRTTGNVGGGTIDAGYAMAIQPDGKVIIAGSAGLGNVPGSILSYQNVNAFVVVMRFNTNGTPDNSFGSGGSVITQVGNYSDFATSIVLQPDGKIMVGGASQNGFYKFFAARYTSNGVADAAYGNGGAAIVDFGTGTNEIANGIALDSFGRAVLCGDVGSTFAVARLQGDALPGPLLKIFLTSTNTAVIKWPYPSSGWSLQANTSLIGSPWSAPAQPVTNDGTNNFIIVSPPALNNFYRLQQQ